MFRFLFDRDTWQELKESLTKNKLRTIITMIGVWWGILLLIGLLGSSKTPTKILVAHHPIEFCSCHVSLQFTYSQKIISKKEKLLVSKKL